MSRSGRMMIHALCLYSHCVLRLFHCPQHHQCDILGCYGTWTQRGTKICYMEGEQTDGLTDSRFRCFIFDFDPCNFLIDSKFQILL